MADKPITEIAADPEKLRQVSEILQQVNKDTQALSELQGSAAIIAEDLIELLEKRSNLYDKLVKQKEREIRLINTGTAEEQAAKAAALEAEKKKIREAEAIFEESIKKRKALLENELKEEIEAYKKKNKAVADAEKNKNKRLSAANKEQLDKLKELTIGSGKAAIESSKKLVASAGPILSTLAIFKKDLALDPVLHAIQKEFEDFDDNYRDVVKSTGLHAESMQDAFTNAINPTEVSSLFTQMEMPLVDIGLTSKDSAEAMKEVLKGAATFRPSFMAADKATAAFTVNLVGGLKKIGVAERDTVKNIDIFNKALGKTPDQANRAVKQLYSVANSLEIDVGKAFKDFGALMPTIAAYGDRAVEVFGELQAQARATGMEVSKLNEFAQGLDTFKGAAEVAQRFNAVLGGTFVSVTDLVEADPADKIGMIQQAMADANVSFEDADRRMKQVITSALGLKDVESAARILGNKDEFEEANAGLETSAASQEDLTKRIQDSMTQAETLRKGISRMGAGFRQFSERTRKLAVGGANAITDSFKAARSAVQTSEQASLGMLINIKGMSGAAGEFSDKMKPLFDQMKKLGVAVGAGGIVAQIGADVYNNASDAQKLALDRLGKNYDRNKATIENIVKKIKERQQNLEEVEDARRERRDAQRNLGAGGTDEARGAARDRDVVKEEKLTTAQEFKATEIVETVKAMTPQDPSDHMTQFKIYLEGEELSGLVKRVVEERLSQ